MLEMECVVFHRRPERFAFLLRDLVEVLADFVDQCVVDVDRIAHVAKLTHDHLRRRLRRTAREWRNRAIELGDAGLDALEIDERREPRYAMTVELQRYLAHDFEPVS